MAVADPIMAVEPAVMLMAVRGIANSEQRMSLLTSVISQLPPPPALVAEDVQVLAKQQVLQALAHSEHADNAKLALLQACRPFEWLARPVSAHLAQELAAYHHLACTLRLNLEDPEECHLGERLPLGTVCLGLEVLQEDMAGAEQALLWNQLLQLLKAVGHKKQLALLGVLVGPVRAAMESIARGPAGTQQAWDFVLALGSEEVGRDAALCLLCALLPIWIASGYLAAAARSPIFWRIVLHGFANLRNALPRKRASLILQLMQAALPNLTETFCVEDLFEWNPNHAEAIQRTISDLILISECLDDTQIHIIAPLMPRLLRMFPAHAVLSAAKASSGNDENVQHREPHGWTTIFPWVNALLARMLQHEKANVQTLGVRTACQLRCVSVDDVRALLATSLCTGSLVHAIDSPNAFLIRPDHPSGTLCEAAHQVMAFYEALLYTASTDQALTTQLLDEFLLALCTSVSFEGKTLLLVRALLRVSPLHLGPHHVQLLQRIAAQCAISPDLTLASALYNELIRAAVHHITPTSVTQRGVDVAQVAALFALCPTGDGLLVGPEHEQWQLIQEHLSGLLGAHLDGPTATIQRLYEDLCQAEIVSDAEAEATLATLLVAVVPWTAAPDHALLATITEDMLGLCTRAYMGEQQKLHLVALLAKLAERCTARRNFISLVHGVPPAPTAWPTWLAQLVVSAQEPVTQFIVTECRGSPKTLWAQTSRLRFLLQNASVVLSTEMRELAHRHLGTSPGSVAAIAAVAGAELVKALLEDSSPEGRALGLALQGALPLGSEPRLSLLRAMEVQVPRFATSESSSMEAVGNFVETFRWKVIASCIQALRRGAVALNASETRAVLEFTCIALDGLSQKEAYTALACLPDLAEVVDLTALSGNEFAALADRLLTYARTGRSRDRTAQSTQLNLGSVCSLVLSVKALRAYVDNTAYCQAIEHNLRELIASVSTVGFSARRGLLVPLAAVLARHLPDLAEAPTGLTTSIGLLASFGNYTNAWLRASDAFDAHVLATHRVSIPHPPGLANILDDRFVRTYILRYLLGFDLNNSAHWTMATRTIEATLALYKASDADETSNHVGTIAHRAKMRCSQVLLLLLVFLLRAGQADRPIVDTLVKWGQEQMASEKRVSLRFMAIWMLVLKARDESRLALAASSTTSNAGLTMERVPVLGWMLQQAERVDTRPSFVCGIMEFLALYTRQVDVLAPMASVALIQQVEAYVLPHVVNSNMTVRLYAASTFSLLQRRVAAAGLSEPASLPGRILHYIQNNADAVRHSGFLQSTFLFGRFDAHRELNLKFLFEACIPLFELPASEVVLFPAFTQPPQWLAEQWELTMADLNLPTSGDVATDSEGEALHEVAAQLETDVQKKIVTADTVAEAAKLAFGETTGQLMRIHDRKRFPLIVAASFVNIPYNLGGLTRTCEIFNADRLVMPDNRVLQSKEYKGVSVSSERWMHFDIVKPEDELVEYLVRKRREGYTIVGLEQTAESVPLQEYTFPERTVLVLGEERRGISPKVLAVIDRCVEIPQFGVTRSLNVHVSAAIAIYAYVRCRLQPAAL